MKQTSLVTIEATVLSLSLSLSVSVSLSLAPQCLVESGAWQRVNTQVPIRSPRYAVFDLAEGKQYKFRVLSANIYGNSEPSEPSATIETLQLKGLFMSSRCNTHLFSTPAGMNPH